MQKGDIAKLKLLLAGISARMTKNRDYFIRAVCTFTSGKKKFDAELSLDGQDWALRFQGSTSPTDAAAFCAFFVSEAEKFDESVLVYTERSAVVTLSATARGVQMKQAEREASDEEKANAANPLLDSGRQYLIRVDQAAALLREIGISRRKMLPLSFHSTPAILRPILPLRPRSVPERNTSRACPAVTRNCSISIPCPASNR